MFAASKKTYISRSKKQDLKERRMKKESVPPKSVKEEKLDEIKEIELEESLKTSMKKRRKYSFDSISDCELNNDDDLLGESDDEEEEQEQAAPKKKYDFKAHKEFKPIGDDFQDRYEQEIDSNVMSVKFNMLKDLGVVASGDPVICKGCGVIFNKFSKLLNSDGEKKPEPQDQKEELKEEVKEGLQMQQGAQELPPLKEGEQAWSCEFCGFMNIVELEPEEVPTVDGVNYILESEMQAKEAAVGKSQNQDISVVFCVDTSGSMCLTKPMKGKHQLRGDHLGDLRKELMKFGDGSSQYMEHEAKNVTYISRLQCVQAAIGSQIEQMSKAAAKRKVGVVSFSNQVCVIGDGSQVPKIFAGDRLNDKDYLMAESEKITHSHMVKPIGETAKELLEEVSKLEENGPTALGPALLTSVTMAAKGKPGSKVIVCTDGLANIGLGQLDDLVTDEDYKHAEEFYEQVGVYAKERGVAISIISIKGENCKLEYLSALAKESGGDVNMVTQEKLVDEFSNILSNPVIATQVKAKVFLHKAFQFRDEDKELMSDDCSLLVRDLGNVTDETQITFEYTLKEAKELEKLAPHMDPEQLKLVPFQVQISYTSLDGKKCVRALSKVQAASDEKEELMENADVHILSTNAKSHLAKAAIRGDYRKAQASAKMYLGKIQGSVKNKDEQMAIVQLKQDMRGLYSDLQKAQLQEQDDLQSFGKAPASKKARKKARKDSMVEEAFDMLC